MEITTIGLDLAKSVFQVHGVDARSNTVLKKQLKRAQMAEFFVKLTPCLIGMEACAGAHHWARRLQAMGHTVRLMAPQFVKPYVKTNKNDAADAEAICEAVAPPSRLVHTSKRVHSIRSMVSGAVSRRNHGAGRTITLNACRPARLCRGTRRPASGGSW